MTGAQIREALEQSLTLERGLLQLAGLTVTYDLSKPEGQRLISLEHAGRPLEDDDRVTVAAPGFLAEGGDLYTVFGDIDAIRSAGSVTDVVSLYLATQTEVAVPKRGRQLDVNASR
jgi:2',3'-cyclic-nucleotide 2'-phosphodiesterase/3'-nucleotidase